MTAVIEAVRTVHRDDAAGLDALLARCSVQTRYQRFFVPVRAIPADYREGALAGDPARHDALVVQRPNGEIIALASLVASPAGAEAELGILVEDGFQRQGLGTALVHELVARARDRGVRRMRATVLPASHGLVRWLGRIVPIECSSLDGNGISVVYRLL